MAEPTYQDLIAIENLAREAAEEFIAKVTELRKQFPEFDFYFEANTLYIRGSGAYDASAYSVDLSRSNMQPQYRNNIVNVKDRFIKAIEIMKENRVP
jgi:hypothetical protein